MNSKPSSVNFTENLITNPLVGHSYDKLNSDYVLDVSLNSKLCYKSRMIVCCLILEFDLKK